MEELEKELAQYGLCDPAKVEEKKRAVVLAKEAAVRWTGTRFDGTRLSLVADHDMTYASQTTTPCFFRILPGNTA